MKTFRVRHSLDFFGRPEPVQVVSSNYSTRSGFFRYSPKVITSVDKKYPVSVVTTDGKVYGQLNGIRYFVGRQVPAV